MKTYKASTKNGQAIIIRANSNIGVRLSDVYGRYSAEKEWAYNWCLYEYTETENAHSFRICSKNTFGFTCAWNGTENDERILRFETKDNSYKVYLDR